MNNWKTFDRFPFLKFLDVEQGSPEWLAARFDSVGSSEVKTAFAGGQGKTRKALMERKIREQHTGKPESHVETFDMRWGAKTEPEARWYFTEEINHHRSKEEKIDVIQVGLISHRYRPGFHASPDGLIIRPEGMYWLEIKCPKFSTHLKYIKAWKKNNSWTHPTEYKQQIRHHSVITGAIGGFFVSYFPEQKAKEILGDDQEWAQIITFVPPPTAEEVEEHLYKMWKWKVDYKIMLQNAELTVQQYKRNEQAKKDKQLKAISTAKKRTEELIRRMRQ